MTNILQTTISNAFFMKINACWFKFQRNLFLRVESMLSHNWFRWLLGTKQVRRHYVDQWWPKSMKHIRVIEVSMCYHTKYIDTGTFFCSGVIWVIIIDQISICPLKSICFSWYCIACSLFTITNAFPLKEQFCFLHYTMWKVAITG